MGGRRKIHKSPISLTNLIKGQVLVFGNALLTLSGKRKEGDRTTGLSAPKTAAPTRRGDTEGIEQANLSSEKSF